MAEEDAKPHDRLMPTEDGRNSRIQNGSARAPRPRSLSENEAAQPDDLNIALVPPVIICDDVASAPTTPTDPRDQNKILRSVLSLSNSHMDVGTSVTPSGSLLGINKPIELRESTLTVNYPENGDDIGGEVSLLYSRHEKIPMKDFAAEVRASRDIERFLNEAVLLLDLHETNIDSILGKMLVQVLDKVEEPESSIREAKKSLFTHDTIPKLSKTIQGTASTYTGGFEVDQSWVCAMCTLPSLQKRHVAIAKLHNPVNLGPNMQEVYFVILVVAPTKEKGTKNALETSRTFATIFADLEWRQRMLHTSTEEEFKRLLWEHTKQLADDQEHPERKQSLQQPPEYEEKSKEGCCLGRGLRADLRRRLPYYWSDFKDGLDSVRGAQKTISTTIFLYFAIILPSIAFGMLNDNNTHGKIDVKKVVYSQTMGGMVFALLSGQPMTIVLTTAPLALFTKVIYTLCNDWDVDFFAMYACVGLWNMFFLIIYSITDLSRLMKWSTRSTEEIFALFISVAFMVDAIKDVYKSFKENYHTPACDTDSMYDTTTVANASATITTTVSSAVNASVTTDGYGSGYGECAPEISMLFLLLMLGTVWLGCYIFNFTKTPYLNSGKRELLADYALPVAVLVMSFFGSYVFRQIPLLPFNYNDGAIFNMPPLEGMSGTAILGSLGLGFCLSLLFFMDQNISSAMVNAPSNKLKKGPAYHWDLLVIGTINGGLALAGLPMVHGALPHSPLHVRAMAEVEDYVEQGHVYQKVISVRETRLTTVFSHVLIGLSVLLLPTPMEYIPRPVLDGLFLYLSINALGGIQMFERIMLLFTEQAAYPPHHYVRHVPQRKVHLFTLTQLIQLGIMCAFGFSPYPYMKMTFPILLLLLLPIRHALVPLLIERKFLNAIDHH